jgi:uncharacterized membrane protein YqhA
MYRMLSLTRYMVLIGVVGLLIAAAAGFVFALVETAELVSSIASHFANPELEIQEAHFIRLVDGFLISTGLLIFALGLYEIFFQPLDVPEALKFTTIGELKSSLASIIALTLAVTFLARLQEGEEATSLLYMGLAVAAVIITLVIFARGDHRT